jgi:predicted RNase H-like nuclease (RuvC/YqgF family)
MADVSGAPVGAEQKEEEVTPAVTPVVVESVEAPVAETVETKKVTEKVTDPDDAEEAEESEDSSKPISYRKSKALMSENKGLRSKNKELTGETEALKAKIAELEGSISSAVRSTVAAKYGLTEAQLKYITGTTAEELDNSAKEYLASFPAGSSVDFSKLKTGTENNKSSGVEGLSHEEILARLN